MDSVPICSNTAANTETQADILGAQIMARAGYDPRDLANMFRTIERQSGGAGGPEWLSSHPNPGNRYERINQEAALLRVAPARGSQDAAFQRIQSNLRGMARAPSMEESMRNQSGNNSGGGRRYPDNSRISNRIEAPSPNFRTYSGGNVFRVAVPDNWRDFADGNAITFAPDGAFWRLPGSIGFYARRNYWRDAKRAVEICALLRMNTFQRCCRGIHI